MTRSLRTVAFGLVLLFPALVPSAVGSTVACAAEASDGPHAALVVGTGRQTLTYCVTLDAPTVSGLRLIQLASAQHGLQYRLGFGGQAVCQLAGVGPTGGDCFADFPDFWGYWHGTGGGGWTWAGSGAASASIGDGDVEGWTWGSGDSGATHPAPPALSIDDICDETATEPPPGDGGGGGGGGDGAGGGGGSGGGAGSGDGSGDGGGGSGGGSGDQGTGSAGEASSQEDGAGGNDDGSDDNDGNGGGNGGSEETRSDTPSPTAAPTTPAADVAALASASSPGGGGPPIAGLVALALIGGLGVAGWLTLRRRDAQGR